MIVIPTPYLSEMPSNVSPDWTTCKTVPGVGPGTKVSVARGVTVGLGVEPAAGI